MYDEGGCSTSINLAFKRELSPYIVVEQQPAHSALVFGKDGRQLPASPPAVQAEAEHL